MAKNKNLESSMVEVPISELAIEATKVYGILTVENRSIPDFHDGCKPVFRRILWTMHNMGLRSTKGYVKTARVVGEALGKYHPHGDLSVGEAISTMVNFTTPLVKGQGNWGSTSSPKAAAMRYTECKLHPLAEHYLLNPYYLKVIDTVPNYDGSAVEPVMLPALLPLPILLGSSGIAVGTTTNIPAFTLESVVDLVKKAFKRKNPKVTPADCEEYLELAYKYGGYVDYDDEDTQQELANLYSNGTGRLYWYCDYEYEDDNTIIVSSLCPGIKLETLMNNLEKIEGVAEVTNQSGASGFSLRVRIRSRISAEVYDKTCELIEARLGSSVTYRVNVTDRRADANHPDGYTVELSQKGVADLINDWIKYRIELEVKALKHEFEELKVKLAKDQLMLKALINIDKLVAIIKKKPKDKNKALSKVLNCTEEEAKTIWSIPIGRFDNMSQSEVKKSITATKLRAKEIKVCIKQPTKSVLPTLTPPKL